MVKWTGTSNDDLNLGTDGKDILDGKGGDDALFGGAGNDIIYGGSGDDMLYGEAGDDKLFGGDGDDAYTLSAGRDTIDGGAGKIDTLDFSDFTVGAHLDMDSLTVKVQTAGGSGTTTFTNISCAYGSIHNDVFLGDDYFNSLYGAAGNDTIRGGGGNDDINGSTGDDKLYGDAGDDWFYLGEGKDTIDGGAGIDALAFDDAIAGVTVSLLKNTVSYRTEEGKGVSTYKSIEDISGSAFKDVITGNNGNNFLGGAGGSDTLNGGKGDDVFSASVGNDTVNGGTGADMLDLTWASSDVIVSLAKGKASYTMDGVKATTTFSSIEGLIGSDHNDVLSGDSGANNLDGGLGIDILDGGKGKDLFGFRTEVSSKTLDLIVDFSVKDDTLYFSKDTFTALSGQGKTRKMFGDTYDLLKASQFHSNNTGLAHDASDRLIYETDTGRLWYDRDGTGKAAHVQIADIGDGLHLTAADFMLV